MKTNYNFIFIFSSFFIATFIPLFSKTKEIPKSLDWKMLDNDSEKVLEWEKLEKPINDNGLLNLSRKRKPYKVKSIGRSIKMNDYFYPEISNYVPNGFVEDKEKIITSNLRLISKTRFCQGENFSSTCSDGVIDFDFNLFNTENFSFNPKFTIQSLTSRGTKFGEGTSMGFKAAKQLSDKWSISLGGENLIHFDDKSDLGRNFYLMASTFYPLRSLNDKSAIFLNLGIGSDFYGYGGNGYIARTTCFGVPNLTGDGENLCNWGPIGSVAFAFNDRIALINEWFGYGYGTGLSFRPLRNNSLSFSLYATDYINNFPKYINKHCPSKKCHTRLYGSISFTF